MPVLATAMPVTVMVVAAVVLMSHAPPVLVSMRVLPVIAEVMRADPIMKASGAPAMGIFVKVMARVPPAGMVPAVDLNPMTKFWHVLLWHDGMETDVTWYPEMGPLGPVPAACTVVEITMPVSLPAVATPRVRPLIVTV